MKRGTTAKYTEWEVTKYGEKPDGKIESPFFNIT